MITIKISTENAAFEDCPQSEVARILRELSERFEVAGSLSALNGARLTDVNGNLVGVVMIRED